MTSVVASFNSQSKFQLFSYMEFMASMQVYKDIWKPSIGDKHACKREFDNCFDKFAIKVVNNGETVGLIYHASSRR